MLQANLISPAPEFLTSPTYIRPTSKGPELAKAGSSHVSMHDFVGKEYLLLELV